MLKFFYIWKIIDRIFVRLKITRTSRTQSALIHQFSRNNVYKIQRMAVLCIFNDIECLWIFISLPQMFFIFFLNSRKIIASYFFSFLMSSGWCFWCSGILLITAASLITLFVCVIKYHNVFNYRGCGHRFLYLLVLIWWYGAHNYTHTCLTKNVLLGRNIYEN